MLKCMCGMCMCMCVYVCKVIGCICHVSSLQSQNDKNANLSKNAAIKAMKRGQLLQYLVNMLSCYFGCKLSY